MKLPYFIRLPAALAYEPGPRPQRRSNAWLRGALLEAALSVSDRLEAVEQLRATALALEPVALELEWSWRRLDLAPPSHQDDQDLARVIRATQSACAQDLAQCRQLIARARQQLAALLGIGESPLCRLCSRAQQAVLEVFGRAHRSGGGLDDALAAGLLAVCCDAVTPPPGEWLGPVLLAAEQERLVCPGLFPPVPEAEPAAGGALKDLARRGVPIKLLLEDDDFDLLEATRALLGLGKNQFALQAIGSRLHNQDLKAGLCYEGFRRAVQSMEGVLHTALACYVAARHGQSVQARERRFLEGVAELAKQVRSDGTQLLHLLAGAAVPYAPDFLAALGPLLHRVQALAAAGAAKGADRDRELEAILQYLAALHLLPEGPQPGPYPAQPSQ